MDAPYISCRMCGETLHSKDAAWLFGAPYCVDCAAEILTEDDVLEDD